MRSFPGSVRTVIAAITVATPFIGCADLVTKNVRHEPYIATTRVLKAEIANNGSAAAGGTTATVHARTANDQPYIERARVPTPPIPSGQKADLLLWPIPSNELPQPGACLHIKVCADAAGTVGESSESNNCAERSFGNDRYCPSTEPCCARDLPASFDWRNWNGTGWLTPVGDQGSCGSCWAFAAISVVEAAANLQRRGAAPAPNLDLSEQQLVTCGRSGDCLGGSVGGALFHIMTDNVVSEATFPYRSRSCVTSSGGSLSCTAGCSCPSGSLCAAPCACTWSGSPRQWRLGNYRRLNVSGAADKVAAVKRALTCRGPLAVCSSNWWHCILLVGWTAPTPAAGESWIIKNSWGIGWGTGGFGTVPVAGDPRGDLVDNAYYVEDVQ